MLEKSAKIKKYEKLKSLVKSDDNIKGKEKTMKATKTTLITITNPWSDYQTEVTLEEIKNRLKKTNTESDYLSIINSSAYKAEIKNRLSSKNGSISAYMHS